MKTAISVPDELFRRADLVARRLHKTRSQVYSEALAEYLPRFDEQSVTAAIDAVVDQIDPQEDRPWLDASRRTLARRG